MRTDENTSWNVPRLPIYGYTWVSTEVYKAGPVALYHGMDAKVTGGGNTGRTTSLIIKHVVRSGSDYTIKRPTHTPMVPFRPYRKPRGNVPYRGHYGGAWPSDDECGMASVMWNTWWSHPVRGTIHYSGRIYDQNNLYSVRILDTQSVYHYQQYQREYYYYTTFRSTVFSERSFQTYDVGSWMGN